MNERCTATAKSATLYIAQPGVLGLTPLAVLLVDPIEDRLFARFRSDIAQVVGDEDAREILAGYQEMLADWATNIGGAALLDHLQETLSNFVRIGSLALVERPANWQDALDELFSNAMRSNQNHSNG